MSTLIGLGGQKRSGKDTVADYLTETRGYVKYGMSDDLAEALYRLNPRIKPDFPVRIGYLYVKPWDTVKYQDLVDAVGYVEAKRHEDVRDLLQLLGTQVGRKMISEDVWLDMAEKKILADLGAGRDVVLTAVRFPNEVEMITALGGTTVWVERSAERRSESLEEPGVGTGTRKAGKLADEAPVTSQTDMHESETSVDSSMFQYVIPNDGELEELYSRVEDLVADLPAVRERTHFFSGGTTTVWWDPKSPPTVTSTNLGIQRRAE